MAVAQPESTIRAAAGPSDSERLVDQLANKIGGLGVELADVAGNLQEVAGRVSGQSDRFGHLQKTAETMVSANHDIASASQAVQTATTAAAEKSGRKCSQHFQAVASSLKATRFLSSWPGSSRPSTPFRLE
jgi:methyl-accepting chemotaxis protein